MTELGAIDGLPLPPFKFLVHMPKLKSGLPARGGLVRLVAAAHMCKSYTLTDWLAFAEVFGMPLRLGRYGPNASAEDIRTLDGVAEIAHQQLWRGDQEVASRSRIARADPFG